MKWNITINPYFQGDLDYLFKACHDNKTELILNKGNDNIDLTNFISGEDENVKRKRGTWGFTCRPCGRCEGHAVPDWGYVPKVILVCLEIVFLAEVLFRHNLGCSREEKPCANKSSLNCFQLIRPFIFFLCGKSVDPAYTNSYSPLKLSSNKRVACCIIVRRWHIKQEIKLKAP